MQLNRALIEWGCGKGVEVIMFWKWNKKHEYNIFFFFYCLLLLCFITFLTWGGVVQSHTPRGAGGSETLTWEDVEQAGRIRNLDLGRCGAVRADQKPWLGKMWNGAGGSETLTWEDVERCGRIRNLDLGRCGTGGGDQKPWLWKMWSGAGGSETLTWEDGAFH